MPEPPDASSASEPSKRPAKPPKLTSLLRSAPDKSEREEVFNSLMGAPDRVAALLVASELDVTLESVLTESFSRELDPDDINLLFGEAGPLVSFVAKVRLAHALEFFGPVTRSDLLIMARIRNAFAHSAKPIGFDNPLIKGNCEHLVCLSEFAKLGLASGEDASLAQENPRTAYILTARLIQLRLHQGTVRRRIEQSLITLYGFYADEGDAPDPASKVVFSKVQENLLTIKPLRLP